MTTKQKRVAAGVPTGGRFADTVHAEAESVTLADPPVGDPWDRAALHGLASDWRVDGFTPDDAERWSSFGWTAEQARQWRAAGFESGQSTWWKTRQFTPGSAAEWHAVTTDPADAQRFRDTGLTPKSAVPWRQRKFSGSDTAEWMSSGIHEPAVAQNWRDEGFTARDAGAFRSAEVSIEGAQRWRRAGFTAEAAAEWARLGLDRAKTWSPTHPADEAEAWVAAGQVSGPDEAQQWEQIGVGGGDVGRWKHAGLTHPESVRPWLDARFDAAEVWMWRAQQFTAEQAATYRAAGLDPRSAADVHRRAAG